MTTHWPCRSKPAESYRSRIRSDARVFVLFCIAVAVAGCSSGGSLSDAALSAGDLDGIQVGNFQRSGVGDAGAQEASESAGYSYTPATCGSRWSAAADGDRGKRRVVVTFSTQGADFSVFVTEGTSGFRTAGAQFTDQCAAQRIRSSNGQLSRLETVPLPTTTGVANATSLVFKQTQASGSPAGGFGAGITALAGFAEVGDTTVRVRATATGGSVAPDRTTFDVVFRAAVAAAK